MSAAVSFGIARHTNSSSINRPPMPFTLPLRPLLFPLIALALLLGACSDDGPTTPNIATTTFAPSLGVDLDASTQTASGLYYRDITVGTGQLAAAGTTVTVRYSGRFPNGTIFDPGTDPIEFRIGRDDVIEGFDEGTAGMRVGGKRQVIIPPHLGYGSSPYQGIPGNSILVFSIELIGVR